MTKFEVGDKVEVVADYGSHKVGEVGTITSINSIGPDTFYRINGDRWGGLAREFRKVKTMFFAMLEDTDNDKQIEYIGPFGSVEDFEKVCKEQNEKRQYRGSVHFVVHEFREA